MQRTRDLQDLQSDRGPLRRDTLDVDPYVDPGSQSQYTTLDVASQRGPSGASSTEHAASSQLASSSRALEQPSASRPEQPITDTERTTRSTRSSRGRAPESSDKAVGPWVVSSSDQFHLRNFLSMQQRRRSLSRCLMQVSNRKVQKRYRERQKVRE